MTTLPQSGRVAGSSRTLLALPSSRQSPALARAHVGAAMFAFPADAIDTAVLLVSEVVSNAVRHAAGGPMVLIVSAASARVGVTVEDTSPEPPARSIAALDEETGRGLELVDSLATAWGWYPSSPGKVVWFELDT